MLLIYPLISYAREYWLKEHYDEEEKALLAEIEEAKQAEKERAAAEGRPMDFDVKRDVYKPDVLEYCFNLDVKPIKKDGALECAPKVPEEKLALQNQVYDRLFTRMETECDPDTSDDDPDAEPPNIRQDFIKQQRYLKYMEQAAVLWEQFTGAGTAKNKFQKSQEEKDEKAKQDKNRRQRHAAELKKRLAKGKSKNQNNSTEESDGEVSGAVSAAGEAAKEEQKEEEEGPEMRPTIDIASLHEQMLKFTALRRANDNKFPAIPVPRNALPPRMGAPQNLPHLEYYRHSKEKYLHRQGQIAQEQVLVHKMLQQ